MHFIRKKFKFSTILFIKFIFFKFKVWFILTVFYNPLKDSIFTNWSLLEIIYFKDIFHLILRKFSFTNQFKFDKQISDTIIKRVPIDVWVVALNLVQFANATISKLKWFMKFIKIMSQKTEPCRTISLIYIK